MSRFVIHTRSSAPARSDDLLAIAESAFGFVPNLLGILAESPAALEAYLQLNQALEQSSLSPNERQVAILAVSRFNDCRYCVAAHSVIAKMQGVPADVIDAIREDRRIDDWHLEALRAFATAVAKKRGWVNAADVAAFRGAGYTNAQVLEVIVAIALKTLSNYVNHIAETELDDAFQERAWRPVAEEAAV